MIKSAVADGAGHITVDLLDGRIQTIAIKNLAGNGRDITVACTESRAGKVLRRDSTK